MSTKLMQPRECEYCGQKSVRTLKIGEMKVVVQEILPPIYATDAHGEIVGLNLNNAPFYILHGSEFCKPSEQDRGSGEQRN